MYGSFRVQSAITKAKKKVIINEPSHSREIEPLVIMYNVVWANLMYSFNI